MTDTLLVTRPRPRMAAHVGGVLFACAVLTLLPACKKHSDGDGHDHGKPAAKDQHAEGDGHHHGAGESEHVDEVKLSPEAIERILQTHPGVRECLVLGVPRDEGGRTECIAAVVAGKSTLQVEELKTFAQARLPAWQVPREWVLVDSLAANNRGKLSRSEWRQRLMERQ